MLTLHLNAIQEEFPRAVIEHGVTPRGEEPKLMEDTLKGKWLRVFPKTGKDVSFLRMLQHRSDKFAPATGHGVLIRRDLLNVVKCRKA